jgi:hypothetical protein
MSHNYEDSSSGSGADNAGAKLTWENIVDVGASSSSIPGNGARKLLDAWLMTSPLGTPRGRCDEYSSKIFPQLRNQGVSIRRGTDNTSILHHYFVL